jgi:MSHA pilin protein MshC
MVELVVVMVLIGVLAAIGVPRLMGDNSMAAAAYGDEVVSALRTAQKSAAAKRRVVCATVGETAVTLRIAPDVITPTTANPACTVALNGETYATSAGNVTANPGPGSLRTLFFQPNGTITTDIAGSAPASGTFQIQLGTATSRSIRFEGTTGHVQYVP